MVTSFHQTICTVAYTRYTPKKRAILLFPGVLRKPHGIKLRRSEHNRAPTVRIEVTYPGTNNFSSFTYDGSGHNVEIVETQSGTVTSTRQFVWCGSERCEARNAGGTITAQYFHYGQTISSTSYLYTRDHLGSISELSDTSGNIQAEYSYGPYGRATRFLGSIDSDFQFAGYYVHAPSKTNLTLHREYSASLGRWLTRDPVIQTNSNLFYYCSNCPLAA